MQIRNGFVSNSSSSSFIINLSAVTPDQLEKLVRYATADKKIVADWKSDTDLEDMGGCGWFIDICENHIRGTTSMSDYDLRAWALHLGIPKEAMSFDREFHHDLDGWTCYQTSTEFRKEARKHIGEWVAYGEKGGRGGIYLSAPTYIALRKLVENEWKQRAKEVESDDFELLKEGFMPSYMTWIDPEYYGTTEDANNEISSDIG